MVADQNGPGLSVRLARLAAFLLPGPRTLRAVGRIRRSGLFDRRYYLDTNPGLHPLYRALPERHYLLIGEAEGRAPASDFVPADYLRLNPDLTGVHAARPFLHYVMHGAAEKRRTRDLPATEGGLTVLPPALRPAPPDAGAPDAPAREVAVVVHLYYRDLWDEIAAALEGAALEYDLFVTLTHRPPHPRPGTEEGPESADAEGASETGGAAPDTPTEDAIRARILADRPDARVIVMPNHGRDIFPFVHLVNSGLLDGYRAVCKIHTKRSPHRQDGEAWRRHLIAGVLPGVETPALLAWFLGDDRAGLWVADGQHYTDQRWWGSNREGVARQLRRVGVRPDFDALSFPAGSIYWLKPALITFIRGLRLGLEDFEPEARQLDATAAHAFERVLGYLTAEAGLEIRQAAQLRTVPDPSPTPAPGSAVETGAGSAAPGPQEGLDAPVTPEARQTSVMPEARRTPALVSAFYLPQFHRIPENDAWWGRGYTEWTAAARGRPVYDGHEQPVLPTDLGFYDLRDPEVMGEQAALARAHGIDAFCVYHYWFSGRRLLQAPVDNLMARPDIAFPFYLCWANESWRRNWDGLSGEVLMEQDYAPGFEAALAADAARYMADPRYLRPDGTRPRFVIYRPEDMPDPEGAIARLRAAFADLGEPAVEIGAVRFHVAGRHPVPDDAVDFWIEMPPHGLVDTDRLLYGGPRGNRLGFDPAPGFRGLIYDYAEVIDTSLSADHAARLPANTIAGAMPSWDNTARRGRAAHMAFGAHPAAFARWLAGISEYRLAGSYRGEVMLNAWNEWAERAVLEPGGVWGRAWLEVVADWRRGRVRLSAAGSRPMDPASDAGHWPGPAGDPPDDDDPESGSGSAPDTRRAG